MQKINSNPIYLNNRKPIHLCNKGEDPIYNCNRNNNMPRNSWTKMCET